MAIEDATGTVTEDSGGAAGHRPETVEQGAFAHARCSCGWRGPARRARERARADAAAHQPDAG
ncbi:hypothetical protein RM572_07470 [Streptomyces sp. DSM 42041]|uniref:Uncharacterized protein n=1 Tax=Streptomyces hazeniae TaxID=3075538 RepID=A0ABU2NSK7_9ACTN|nr:hypothetical protein [Streptomyces sp. DSM 42041]MDT0378618.1 hypothetical protein [Streptomyces sp. DSM 42041]